MVRMFGEFLRPEEGRKYNAYTMGWNYRTQELPAAFARSQLKEGYGKGCPWSCQYAEEISYDPNDYPETMKLLADSLVICSEPYPIYPQPLELMKYYAEAFHKVFDNIDEVVEIGASLEQKKPMEDTAEVG